MNTENANTIKGVKQLIEVCGNFKKYEKALIISDNDTLQIGKIIEKELREQNYNFEHLTIVPFEFHGQEPPSTVSELMKESDLIFGLTKKSMFHTDSRMKATDAGTRYLSLPDYSREVLMHPSLQADFMSFSKRAFAISDILSSASKAVITSEEGTNLKLSIKNRSANPAPGWCYENGTVASPPDAETNVAIVEDESEGILVVDGSIPYDGLGLLSNPVEMIIKKGRVKEISGPKKYTDILNKILFDDNDSDLRRTPAELGIGLNDLASFCGILCIDEGVSGTVHIGLGSNITIGGENRVNFHLDLIIRKPTLMIDDIVVIKKGEFFID